MLGNYFNSDNNLLKRVAFLNFKKTKITLLWEKETERQKEVKFT